MITDVRQLRKNKAWFRNWLNRNSISEDDDYKDHAVVILESWLDEKMSVLQIGNLFRFDNPDEYNRLKLVIMTSPSFQDINGKDSRGRPNAALNHYGKYLEDPSTGDLKARLDAEVPTGGRRVLGGVLNRRNG